MGTNYVKERWKDHQKRLLVEACLSISITGIPLRKMLAEHGEPLILLKRAEIKKEPVHWFLKVEGGTVTVAGKLWPWGHQEEHVLGLVQHSRGRWGAPFFLVCPNCKGRRRNLYSVGAGSRLYCRKCHDLAHASNQMERKTKRAAKALAGMAEMMGFPLREVAETFGVEKSFGYRPRPKNGAKPQSPEPET